MLREVKPVANDKFVRDFKAAVVNLNVNLAATRLVKERANFDAVSLFILEVVDKEIHSGARIDDVLDKQDVAPLGVVVEVLEDIDFAASVRIGVVAGGDEKIELDGNG